MDIYGFEDYVEYLKARLESSPQKRGELKGLASAIGSHPSHISQVMTGKRHLTTDQALAATRYLGLDSQGRDYFLNLVTLARAETEDLKEHTRAQLLKIKNLGAVPSLGIDLSEEGKLEVLLSSWYYFAILVLISISSLQTIDALSHHLNLPRHLVSEALKMLVNLGCCRREGDRFTTQPTHWDLDKHKHLLARFQSNWRFKAFERLSQPHDSSEKFVTQLLAVSKENEQKLTAMVNEMLLKSTQFIGAPGESEVVRCINVDWFKI